MTTISKDQKLVTFINTFKVGEAREGDQGRRGVTETLAAMHFVHRRQRRTSSCIASLRS